VTGTPVLVPAAVAVDVLRGRFRLPALRLWSLAVQCLALDLVAVLSAGVLWLVLGGGRGLGSERSLAVHSRLQWWWVGQVLAAARRSVGLRFEIDAPDALTPGPLVVIGRHCSYGDAVLPAVLFGHDRRLRLRYVLAAGLAWVPALDLYGGRLRNHFVDRGSGAPAELEAVGRVADGMGAGDAVVIFPEGGFFTEARRARALQRIAAVDPQLAGRAAGLRHVLPPRPGGWLALLEHAPAGTDVVLVGHVGFEGFSTMAELWRAVPLDRPVTVRVWRFPASSLPAGRAERVAWLYDRWEQLDRWIDETAARRAASQRNGGFR